MPTLKWAAGRVHRIETVKPIMRIGAGRPMPRCTVHDDEVLSEPEEGGAWCGLCTQHGRRVAQKELLVKVETGEWGASDFARSDGQAVSNEMLGNTILHTRELLDEAGVDWRKFTEEAGDETIAYSPLKLAIGRRGGVTNQGGLRAQQRLQADAAAARESEAEMARLRKTIRDMAKHLPESERAPYLQAAKQTAKSGAQKGNGGEAQNLGLVAPAPQAGTQAAVATPVTPVVAEAIPTQAVVLATPQGKAGGAKLSWYVFPQFQAGNKVSLYDAAAGQKKGGGAAAKPKAKAKAAPKRGASVPPKSGSGGSQTGRTGGPVRWGRRSRPVRISSKVGN